jgi:hypothetical protein
MLRKRPTRLEPVFNAYGEVCGMPTAKAPAACGSPPTDNSKGIALVPGRYDVQIYSVKYPMPKIEIPPDKRSAGTGLTREEYYVPDKSIIFDAANPVPAGFAEFEWNLTAKQLDTGNTVEFYFINVALDKVPKSRRKIEDLSEIGKAIDYSKMYRKILEPKVFRKSAAGAHTVTVKVNEK